MIRRNKRRYILSLVLFTIYGVIMAFAGTFPLNESPLILFAWLIFTPVFAYFLGMTWQFDLVLRSKEKESTMVEESSEKRKRERLDNVLRDLSDDDLMTLRQRLQDGTIDEEVLYERMIGDDGELIQRN